MSTPHVSENVYIEAKEYVVNDVPDQVKFPATHCYQYNHVVYVMQREFAQNQQQLMIL